MAKDRPSQQLPARAVDASVVRRHRDALVRRIGGAATSDPQPALGNKLRLLRRIGRGGMGTVWEAEHLGLGIRVAVKRLHPELARDDRLRRRFLREARSVAAVKHPHIVQILDVATDDDGVPFLMMELLAGESLRELLRRDGPMPWSQASRLLVQLAAALHCAHSRGIVHRDLKPSNVIVLGSGADASLKIIDFGLAKQDRADPDGPEITRTGDVFGSPGYMSPEQLRGGDVDARSDVYSLGCLAFEMLTGRRPFAGPTIADLVVQHLTHEAPLASPLDADPSKVRSIRGLLRRALAKDPRARHRDAEAFGAEVASIDAAQRLWARLSFGARGRRTLAIAVVMTATFVALNRATLRSERVDATAEPAAFGRAFERPLSEPTPTWPQTWLGRELGLAEPGRDPNAPDRTGHGAPEGLIALWGADPRSSDAYRLVLDRSQAFALSAEAVEAGLTLGHAVADPVRIESSGHGGDPSTGRVFWRDPIGFPLRAIGTLGLGPGCTGVQVGPVHILTAAQCIWGQGGFVVDDLVWQPGDARDHPASSVKIVRAYVPEQWPQNNRPGLFNWGIAIAERDLGDAYFGVSAVPDDELLAVALHHKGYPVEQDHLCETSNPPDWHAGANRMWGNPEPIRATTRGLRAPSPVSGWDRVLATSAVASRGHLGGPFYYYDASRRPVVVAVYRSGCTDKDGGTGDFCGFTPPWRCGIPTELRSQAMRLEPEALYGHLLPVLTWWGVDDDGLATCLLEGGC